MINKFGVVLLSYPFILGGVNMRRDLNIDYHMDLDLYDKGERIFNNIYTERYIGKKYVINKRYGGISPSYTLRLRDVFEVSEKRLR